MTIEFLGKQRKKQARWLHSMQKTICKLAAEIELQGDLQMPRGYALGKCNEAVVKLTEAAALIGLARRERQGSIMIETETSTSEG